MTLMFQISFLGIILNETMIFITFVCCRPVEADELLSEGLILFILILLFVLELM